MKYPQLVSTRAVNAISDWLVSRLEQLGVEAPQIYTRLLLSLLQSSVQINDPIEFSNLEKFFANRKGNNRRYLPCDTDSLKKLNAIQCLREIVSSEQEIATIENLVDELCEKLKDIEKQTTDIEDEDQQLVATLSVATTVSAASSSSAERNTTSAHHNLLQQQHHHIYSNNNNKHHNNKEDQQQRENSSNEGAGISGKGITAIDLETDPKKRYFRAFPALSKEMEESFRVWRRNAKSLTWPVVDRSNIISSISSAASSTSSSSSSTLLNSICSTSGGHVAKASSEECGTKAAADSNHKVVNCIGSAAGSSVVGLGNLNSCEIAAGASTSIAAAGGVKRKSKRRRNQALLKGKTIQNLRKNSAGNTIGGASGGSSNLAAGFGTGNGGRHYRNSSPTFWDTDFEGSWEMGRDLIKEFIIKQNRNNNRNRSTSESAAYGMRAAAKVATTLDTKKRAALPLEAPPPPPKAHNKANEDQEQKMYEDKKKGIASNEQSSEEHEEKTATASSKNSSPLLPVVDISFCCGDDDDEYDDVTNTFDSVSELAAMESLAAVPPRRLYQRRDICSGFGSHEEIVNTVALETSTTSSSSADDQLDFAQFKAKFNSSVEALWKDAELPADSSSAEKPFVDAFALHPTSSAQMAAELLPAVAAPFKENLRNFWSNYYSHHFDLAKIPQHLQQSIVNTAAKMEESSVGASLSMNGATTLADTSDFYSMPPMHLNDFDKSVGAMVRHDFSASGCGAGGDDEHNTPIGVFLQNSIWSESSNATAVDTDESFYLKVWNSTKKLNQLDAARGNKIITAGGSLKLHDTAFNFPPLNVSKWSEGINAGPQQSQQQQLRLPIGSGSSAVLRGNNTNINLLPNSNVVGCIDCTDSNTNTATASVSSTSCSSSYTQSSAAAAATYSWQTPIIGQNLQADLQSWSASNPISLTEMYGGGTSSTDGNKLCSLSGNLAMEPPPSPPSIVGPSVTLPNHSPTGSGFIAYARIKAVRVLQHDTCSYPPMAPRTKETHYAAVGSNDDADDDGENLLTSERTHFHPIKTYADGHTFDICSALDVIDYQRRPAAVSDSDSGNHDNSENGCDDGYLYFEGHRYLPYTRSDKFMSRGCGGNVADEEPAASSATPLYATSNCDANMRKNTRNAGEDFVLKFRLRGREIATQTEEVEAQEFLLAPTRPQQRRIEQSSPTHPLYTIFTNTTGMQQLPPTMSLAGTATGSAAYNDAIEALNKAVAAAAKAAAAANLPQENHWIPSSTEGVDCGIGSSSSYCYQPLIGATIWNTSPPQLDAAVSSSTSRDKVDFSGIEEQQQWSMRAIREKCQLKGHSSGDISGQTFNNNNIEMTRGGLDGGAASLWGMCAACNSEFKSVPANRLLRDELQLEADEIMSDLKYMQDLYIGGGAGEEDDDAGVDAISELSVWDYDEEEEEEKEEADASVPRAFNSGGKEKVEGENVAIKQQTSSEPMEEDDDEEVQTQAVASTVLQKVNQLIADLLRPETVKDAGAGMAPQPQQFSGSLWLLDNNERNIWQDDSDAGVHTETQSDATNDNAGATAVLEAHPVPPFNWAHENLAQIWQQNTPPPPPPSQPPITAAAATTVSSTTQMTTQIAAKNYKNLQASFDAAIAAAATNEVMQPPPSDAAQVSSSSNFGEQQEKQQQQQLPPPFNNRNEVAVAFKRVQQFLNSNAAATTGATAASAKLKLANRKRRHSASQHFFPLPLSEAAVVGKNATSIHNNNNSIDMADLNFKYFVANASAVNAFSSEIEVQKFFNSSLVKALAGAAKKSSNHSDAVAADVSEGTTAQLSAPQIVPIDAEDDKNDNILNMQQTVITCKYWTTLDPLTASAPGSAVETDAGGNVIGDSSDGATYCLIDKNSASILNHVTMVTRPLTR